MIELLWKNISKLFSSGSGATPTEFQVILWAPDAIPSHGQRGRRPCCFRTRWSASSQ